MRYKVFLYIILVFCLFRYLPVTHAQKVGHNKADSTAAARKDAQDSAKAARQHIMDSTRDAQHTAMEAQKEKRQHTLDSTNAARTHAMDSAKAVRDHNMDSLNKVRKHFSDSLGVIRKYHDSKHYKDSVSKARTLKSNKLKSQRQASLDSAKAIRQHSMDSVAAIRKANMDNIHSRQKHRSDSLALIKKYRESRRFRDSVSIVKHDRADSIAAARKAFSEQIASKRKAHQDSISHRRKFVTDSLGIVRKKHQDSVKVAQKARADKQAKDKAEKEKVTKAKEKAKQQKLQLALDLKIKQKREKWSNQSMLKKKWTAPRQAVQNTFTRYNYYFNSDRKMDEALANMQRGRRENYDSLIGLYPFDPNRDSTLLSADMDSIIRKVSVGIQIHDPRTKWEDDMYLLLGEANYYKGNYDQASTSFRYIIAMDEEKKKKKAAEQYKKAPAKKNGSKEEPSIVEDDKKTMLDFLKHKAIHNDAILWLSRTYTESHQLENAGAVLSLLDADPKLPEELKGKLALEKAFLHLMDNDHKNASKQLEIAAKDKNVPDWLRQRSSFLNGQLQQREGNYAAAAASFTDVLDYYPKLDMDFYSRKYAAYNTLLAGNKVDDAISSFKKLLKDAKYATYYEQIYYVLGQLSVGSGDNAQAIVYLQKGLKTPKTTKKQKAINYAALGTVYYNTGNYVMAKHAYDSSAALLKYAARDSGVIVATLRSKALESVVGPATTIHDQDSLLDLASMTEKDQRAVIKKYLRMLQQRRDDSIYRAENVNVTNVAAAQPENPDEGTGANWYFSNPAQVQQGFSDFKKKWGNRPLTDNWRRSATQTFAGAGTNGPSGGNNDSLTEAYAAMDLDENGFPTEESLLAAIPTSASRKDRANNLIQKAYIDLANAYVKQLEDYPLGIRTLDTMEKRYPNNPYGADDLYLRYIVGLRKNQLAQAQPYADQLLAKYPESEYAKLVRPSEDGSNLQNMAATEANFYDETYGMLMQRQYTDVLMRIKEARKQYKGSKYSKRYEIMEGIALAGSGNYNQADTLLREFIKTNPSDSLKDWAEAVLKYIGKNNPAPPAGAAPAPNNGAPPAFKAPNAGANPAAPGGPANPLSPNGSIPNGSPVSPPANPSANPSAGQNNVPGQFTYNAKAPHYCVVSIPGIESRTLGLKAAIADFNTFRFADKNLSTLMDVEGAQLGTIVVKAFPDAASAKSYMNTLKGTSQIFREYKANEYHVFIISADNYLKVLSDKSIDNYLKFYSQHY